MKKGIVLKEKKDNYGFVSDAIIKSGYDILFFDEKEKIRNYDYLIVLYNKILRTHVKTNVKNFMVSALGPTVKYEQMELIP